MLNAIERKWDLQRLKKSDRKKYVCTDRGFNLLKSNPKNRLRIVGKLNYKTAWANDFYCHKLFHGHVRNVPRLTADLFDTLDMKTLVKKIDKLCRKVPVVEFTDSEFRKTLGLDPKNFSNEAIHRIILDYSHLRLEGVLYEFWDEETRAWMEVSLDDSMLGLAWKEPETVSKRGGPDRTYAVRANMAALFMFQSIRYHRFSLFKTEFYRLPAAAQLLYRAISPFQNVKLDAKAIRQILGTSGGLRIKKVKSILGTLKKNHFIVWYNPPAKGKTTFHIWRYLRNYKPIVLPEQIPDLIEDESSAISTPSKVHGGPRQKYTPSRGKKVTYKG